MAEQPEREPSLQPFGDTQGLLRTFVGRDTEGPIYNRLELMQYGQQLEHIPLIVSAMLFKLERDQPEAYHKLLHQYVIMDAEIDGVDPPQFLDASEFDDSTIAFKQFAGHLLAEKFLDPKTGLLVPEARYMLNKTGEYQSEPLVQTAIEFSKILKEDDLKYLGDATVCAAVTITDTIHAYHNHNNGNSAA